MTFWFARWKRGTKAQALVSAYRDLPAEHREWAHYTTFDGFNEGYHVWDLTPGRVEWWLQMEFERHGGYSPREVYENWACECRRVEMAVD